MGLATGLQVEATTYNDLRSQTIAEFNASSRRNIGGNYWGPGPARSVGDFVTASDVTGMAHDFYYVNASMVSQPSDVSQNAGIANYELIGDGIATGSLMTQLAGLVLGILWCQNFPKQGNSSGCQSGCIGLCQGCTGGCYSGCYSACTSCSGSCDGGCQGGCGSGCGASCTAACAGSCTQTCGYSCASGSH